MLNGGWFLSVFFCQLLHSYVAEPVLQNNAWRSKVISCALIIEDFDINKEGLTKRENTRKKCKTFIIFGWYEDWTQSLSQSFKSFWPSDFLNAQPEHSEPFPKTVALGLSSRTFDNNWTVFKCLSHISVVSEWLFQPRQSPKLEMTSTKKTYNCRAAEDKQTKQLSMPS